MLIPMVQMSELLKSPLHLEHQKLGAKFVPFSGYEMPVQYKGVLEEHLATRQNAGLFDVSHMGALKVSGPGAEAFLNKMFTRDVSKVAIGHGAYSLLCNEDGGCLDDLIFYRTGNQEYLVILNAGNKNKDLAHLQKHAVQADDVALKALFHTHSLIALQGPRAFEVLKSLGLEPSEIKAFSFYEKTFGSEKILLAQTGYTGELGVEILAPNSVSPKLWEDLLKKGESFGLKACGLAARDTLRTEMGYSLYGHELNENINPVSAGLSWAISFAKTTFFGKEALLKEKENPTRKLICLKNNSRQAPRGDMPIVDATGEKVGHICSGTFAPSLGYAIGMALVKAKAQAPYQVEIRGQLVPFGLCKRPFYTGNSLAKKE